MGRGGQRGTIGISAIVSIIKIKEKKDDIANTGEDVEKRKPLCSTVSRNVNWYSHYKKQYEGSTKNSK